MSATAERNGAGEARLGPAVEPDGRSRLGAAVLAGSALLVVGAGLLLWSRHGDAVFLDTVLNAFAWCF